VQNLTVPEVVKEMVAPQEEEWGFDVGGLRHEQRQFATI
jgi:hypothetical protein